MAVILPTLIENMVEKQSVAGSGDIDVAERIRSIAVRLHPTLPAATLARIARIALRATKTVAGGRFCDWNRQIRVLFCSAL